MDSSDRQSAGFDANFEATYFHCSESSDFDSNFESMIVIWFFWSLVWWLESDLESTDSDLILLIVSMIILILILNLLNVILILDLLIGPKLKLTYKRYLII